MTKSRQRSTAGIDQRDERTLCALSVKEIHRLVWEGRDLDEGFGTDNYFDAPPAGIQP